MRLKISNCNNIDNGEFDIVEGRLNIKYAMILFLHLMEIKSLPLLICFLWGNIV